MFFRQIHGYFPFWRLLLLLLGLSVGVQLAVITYNHLSGYYVLSGYLHFFLRLARGIILSLSAAFLIAYPDLFIIRYFNKSIPWGKQTALRILLQMGFAVTIAVIIALAVTFTANRINPYSEDLSGVLITNALIIAVANLLMMAVLEGWIYYIESKKATLKAETLEKELSQIRFEVLKSQINPHFMFNSLNVLSGLINRDTVKAQQFIDEFSQVYRYVLETIEQPVTTLGRELDFMHSYLFLQQIRYGRNLGFSVDVPAALLNCVLPPLSLQVLLENAIKHNIVNESKPLRIEVYSDGYNLVVKNNLQPKISSAASTGLGLKNLVKRYALITGEEPSFKIETGHYIARIPLINPESDEHTDR
ncbi:histidine kinase [Lentimicrobium saccharophilum]|uniref:Histidine kinase n=1 Tax=Lentimicrobium saccharophilum TaxID=1678841 RepID=A0A0S7BNE1_9BACT|nr:histidine kinase [Lentimicrobium saccharophilum]GAP42037.1 histidine kinase [Lentimicrobium saccharophilum]